MDVFENLLREKKERIINAAMGAFAVHGYHKASAADIAKTAGISKAMVFTYFGSKRGCYEFMCNEMYRISLNEFNKIKEEIFAITDYFERISQYLKIKMKILKQYPSFLSFAKSMYTERDEEVRPIINRIFSEAYHLRKMLSSADIDPKKFKNPAGTERVRKIVRWLSQGCTEEWAINNNDSIETIIEDFNDCMIALKKHFYKGEYL